MSENREVNEMPIQILQQLISVLLVNQNEENIEGQVDEFYLNKKGDFATVIYDNEKVSYIANFVKDKIGNWFFVNTITVGASLKSTITEEAVENYSQYFEEQEEDIEEENTGIILEKEPSNEMQTEIVFDKSQYE